MNEISSNIKDRVLQLAKIKESNKQIFFRKTGLKYSNFTSRSKKSDLGSKYIAKIAAIYPDVNLEWLITGEGKILKEAYKPMYTQEEYKAGKIIEHISISDISVGPIKFQEDNLNYMPQIKKTSITTFGETVFAPKGKETQSHYVVPLFQHKNIDFMLEVDSDAMYPTLKSGDLVACTILEESQFIQWNKIHVIATKEQGVIIKRIHQGSQQHFKMVSDNKNYPPFNLPIDDIKGIALVAGMILLE